MHSIHMHSNRLKKNINTKRFHSLLEVYRTLLLIE